MAKETPMARDTSGSVPDQDDRFAAKFPPCRGLSHVELQDALKAARGGDHVAVAKLMDHRRCTALGADELLREAAGAGYVEWVPQAHPGAQPPFWQLGDLGLRLLADDLGPSIGIEEADRTLAEFLTRVRAHNQGNPSLVITEVRHFGSTLLHRERDRFGDVDVDLTLARAPEVTSEDFGQGIYEQLEREQRTRNAIGRRLERNLPKLSLTFGEVELKGFAHQVVYRFNPNHMEEGLPDEALTPAKETEIEVDVRPLPSFTAVAPLVRDLERDSRVVLPDRRGIDLESLSVEEIRAWAGVWKNGRLWPLDLRRGLAGKVLGARDLLLAWRDPAATGRDLLEAALDWASDREAKPFRWQPVRLHVEPRSRFAHWGPLYVTRVAERIEARLCAERAGTTRGDIALQHGLALALGRLVDAVGQHHGASVELVIWPPAFIEKGADEQLGLSRDVGAFVRFARKQFSLTPRTKRRDRRRVRTVFGRDERQVEVDLGAKGAEAALHNAFDDWAAGFQERVVAEKGYLWNASLDLIDYGAS